jgi:hypothetical protein
VVAPEVAVRGEEAEDEEVCNTKGSALRELVFDPGGDDNPLRRPFKRFGFASQPPRRQPEGTMNELASQAFAGNRDQSIVRCTWTVRSPHMFV